MSTTKSFGPFGPSFRINADASAPAGTQVTLDVKSQAQNYSVYRVVNPGPETVYLGWGSDATQAQSNATQPTTSGDSNTLVMLPNSIEVLRFAPDIFFSGQAAAANPIYITIGDGV